MNIGDKVLEKCRSSTIGRPEDEVYFESNAALLIPADCESGDGDDRY